MWPSETSQAQKDTCCMISFTGGIYMPNSKLESRMAATKGWGVGERGRHWSKGPNLQL